MCRLKVPLLFVLLALLLAPMSVSGEANPDETPLAQASQPVLYLDRVYGYSVEVPPNWVIEPTTEMGWGGVAQFTIYPQGAASITSQTEVDWSRLGALRVSISVLPQPRPDGQELGEFLRDYQATLPSDVLRDITTVSTASLTIPSLGAVVKQSQAFRGTTADIYLIPVGRWVMTVKSMPAQSPWDADFQHILSSLKITSQVETRIDNRFSTLAMQSQAVPGPDGIMVAWDQDPPGWGLPFLGNRAITQAPNCPGLSHYGTWYSEAIDYGLPTGTAVQATDSGYVLAVVPDSLSGGWGNLVKLRHATDGFDSWYAHLNSFSVQAGRSIVQYEVVGYSGNTGTSTAPHLHFHARTIDADASHWIRTLPGTTWNSGNPYSPCTSGDIDGWANGG